MRALGLPVQVFAALKQGFFRKPCVGMWQLMVRRHGVETRAGFTSVLTHVHCSYVQATKFNGGVPIDMAKSFYLGDAAGRPAGECATLLLQRVVR